MAGDDNARLDDLHAMFDNRSLKLIFCARGGYGTLRLLDRIDYERIRRHPKIIVGYSDITALLLAVHEKTGLVTFHGPVVTELTKNSNRNLNSFFDLVSTDESLRLDLNGGAVLAPGKTRGRLLGGNLSLISHLIGTPYMPSLKGAILFIEDIGEQVYRIDRMLTHLKLSGHLDDIRGFVMGEFVDCGDRTDLDLLFVDLLAHLNALVGHALHGRQPKHHYDAQATPDTYQDDRIERHFKSEPGDGLDADQA